MWNQADPVSGKFEWAARSLQLPAQHQYHDDFDEDKDKDEDEDKYEDEDEDEV